jgi:hypothetical protein
MPDFKDTQKYEGQETKVIKQYKEQNRDGSFNSAQRQPPYKQHDLISRIKRKDGAR